MARTKQTAEEYNATKQQGIIDKIITCLDQGKKNFDQCYNVYIARLSLFGVATL